ncbi:hypothetical protein [Akkermansia sp.]|uniref:hypothetical protein n=1 Tax=Akkermansia sp. TaxID=1872421 RepID=UPI0025B920EE|nr:hypothetical protein [Akkermansia sp.]MCC8149509.1 hypothetical protein [Akkermansia sp.]
MQKVRQPVGMALMILAFLSAIYGTFPWGIAVGAFLFLLGVIVAVSRFSAVVWSWCLFALGIYLAAPFIWMWNPDYFFSRSFDVLFVSGCLVGSLVLLTIRFAVIPVLWPKIFHHFVKGGPTLEDLAPERGKTVAELRNGIEPRQVNFLFGQADEELVEKWGKIAQGIAALSKSRKRLTIWVVSVLLIWPAAVFLLSGGMGGALDRDIDRMWATRPFRDGMVVSTPEAMNAARRVFRNARSLRGLTMEQARSWLKTDQRNAAFKLGKPRYDFEEDETVLVLSDGRDSIRLVAVFNDAGQIIHSWPEEYMTLMVRDLEKD